LKTDLGDLGLGTDEDLQPLLEDLSRRGYVFSCEQGFLPGKPALTMAQVMGRIFPKMMGTGFLAYLVQTIDEVSSGRKELEAAAIQFDQTLKMQGVPLKRGSEPQVPRKVAEAPPLAGAIRERSLPKGPHTPGPTPLSHPREQGRVRVLGSSVDSLVFETRRTVTVVPPSPQPPPSADVREEEHEFPETLQTQDTDIGSHPGDGRQEGPLEASSDAATEPPAQTDEATCLEELSPQAEPSSPPLPPLEPTAAADDPYEPLPECTVPEEASLEKEISRFEEELAAQCPLCKTSTVLQRHTPAGRTYYQCGNRECSFVSWGRPYHVPCPRCQNPFMVEVPEIAERRLLRCPRATCRYTRTLSSPSGEEAVRDLSSGQGLPPAGDRRVEGARRRVVRRRVVRKKK
jgi:hypothetical protein